MSLQCNKQLTDVSDIKSYIHCKYQAIFTLVSGKTGKRFTYRILKANDKYMTSRHTYVLSLLTGDDNTSSYTRIARMYPGVCKDGLWSQDTLYIFNLHGCQSTMAVRLLFEDTNKYLDLGGQFWIPARCRVCGRLLTTPEAIAEGVGHRCKAKEKQS